MADISSLADILESPCDFSEFLQCERSRWSSDYKWSAIDAEGSRSGCQKSGFPMVHKSLKSCPQANRPIRHQAQHYAWDSPWRRRPTRVTRYELVSRGAREAKNELKAGLFGSDETWPRDPLICLGMMSASEMRDLESDKRFP